MARNKINRFTPQQILAEKIVKTLNKNPTRSYNYRQLSKEVGVTEKDTKELVQETLKLLKEQGFLVELEPGKFKLKPKLSYVTGKIELTMSGAAYVVVDETEKEIKGIKEDIYIAPKNVNHALHGDIVKVYLYAKRKDRQQEGEIVEVLERAKLEFVGIIKISQRFAFVIPDSNKMAVDIFVPLTHIKEAQDGQKVLARITDWPKGAKNPFGEVTEVLGFPGDNDTEMDAILAEYGFPLEFPSKVEQEAADIKEKITKAEISKRRDFRHITTFTIDPVDAKDFDDALSIQKLENGNWEIGVHIADVSHYVKPGTALDDEAFERATSVYLVDRVIPMLPEKLSNKVCSLRPHEEKLCFSAVFEMDDKAKLINEWFGRTVINSDHRFTYEEAQKVIETGDGPFKDEVLTLDRLAKTLRAERFKNGSIAFEKVEVKFKLDEKGNPIGVYTKEIKDSNQLIEDFMLLANRRVAEFVGKVQKGQKKKTFVYRVHDKPVEDKLNSFAQFASKFGYRISTKTDKEIATSLNKLIKDVHGKKEQNVLEQLAIRTMSKALYTTDNIGHYGLSFQFYTHFTSPIRRYPDVMVHRLLQHYLDGGQPVDEVTYEQKCKHSSEMEIKASEAERASIKYKQVQFLQDKVGKIFDGLISGVTDWGIYVELVENKCEGLIRMRDLTDDFYEFDEENYCIFGRRKHKKFQLGDTIKVRIKNTDLIKKQIDFTLAGEDDEDEVAPVKPQGRIPQGLFDETSPYLKSEAGRSNNRDRRQGNRSGNKSKNKNSFQPAAGPKKKSGAKKRRR